MKSDEAARPFNPIIPVSHPLSRAHEPDLEEVKSHPTLQDTLLPH